MAGIPHPEYDPKTGVERWVERRLPVGGLIYNTLMIPTPKNLSWMWIWGIVLTVCLFLQIATGVSHSGSNSSWINIHALCFHVLTNLHPDTVASFAFIGAEVGFFVTRN